MNAATARAVADRRANALALRAASALVMAPLAAAAVLLGRPFFAALVALACAALAWEWDRLCAEGRFGPTGWLLLAVTLAGVLAASLGYQGAAALGAVPGALLVYAAAKAAAAKNPAWHAAGVFYLVVPSAALLWLYRDSGAYAVLWLFAVVWATDIGAFACGRLLGGPRLAPRLSPNKTWAGLCGGLLAAAVAGALLAPLLGLSARGFLAGLSVFVSLAAQGGDLLELAVKRHFHVKDMSRLIPGHGGLFDRVDGLLAAAPAAALMQLLSGGGLLAWR